MDCDPDSLQPQQIRIVCESSDLSSVGCDAIYEGQIADTIVRVPNSCGQGPFARLRRVWPSENQEIPDSTLRKFRKRQEAPGTVQNAIIDYDFASIQNVETPVVMEVTGSNNPAAPVQQNPAAVRRRSAYGSQKMRRGLTSRGLFDGFFDFLEDLNRVSVDENGSSEANFQQNFPVISESIACAQTETTPAFDAGFNMNVDVDVTTRVSYGFVVSGTIIPPNIDDVGIYAALSGNAAATFNIDASAKATLDSGRIELARIGLSPLQIPGIVNVGPSASIGVQGIATLGVTGNIVIGASMGIPKVEMRFPPSQGGSAADAVSNDAPLRMTINPEVGLSGSLEAHLTPRIGLGIDLISGFATAEVFLDVDVSGKASLNVEASVVASTDSNPDTSVRGCMDIDAGIAFRGGATGSVAGIFDGETTVDIFRRDFKLFQRCFGDAAPQRRDLLSLPAPSALEKRQAQLLCPGTVSAATSLVDGFFKGA